MLSAQADSNGHFTINDVPAGQATLHIEGQGVNANVGTLDLHEGKELHVHISADGAHANLDCVQEVDEKDGDNNNVDDGEHNDDTDKNDTCPTK